MELKEFIQEHLLNSKGILNANLFRNDYFKRKYPVEYALIGASYPEYTDIRQKIYAHLRGGYHYCPGCGNICNYNYKTPKAYCSKECGAMYQAKYIKQASYLKRYGTLHPCQSQEVKEKNTADQY